jgi:hypothetical protein
VGGGPFKAVRGLRDLDPPGSARPRGSQPAAGCRCELAGPTGPDVHRIAAGREAQARRCARARRCDPRLLAGVCAERTSRLQAEGR